MGGHAAVRGDDYDGRLARLEKDMYFGNGKPAMTIRMQSLEDTVDVLCRNISKLIWVIVPGILVVVGDAIVHAIK